MKPKIVAIVGMEQFNHGVWKQVQQELSEVAEVNRWTDVELDRKDATLGQQIREADCVFLSMLHQHDAAEFLHEQIAQSHAKTIFAFESMPEIMALNKVGDYVVANSGKKAGMPEPVKKIAMMLVKGREEDALYGYTKLMKVMQTAMRFMPAKMRDFKNWMTVNVYWNQPLQQNITSMFKLILNEYFGKKLDVPAAVEMPMMGVYHPDAPAFFRDIKSYNGWVKQRQKADGERQKAEGKRQKGKPGTGVVQITSRQQPAASNQPRRVALMFFRKHLAQERSYIDDAIRAFEAEGMEVLPMFVAGIEGHVAVRDFISKEPIDVLVSMIGFAFVGGPAGSTKPGLQKQVVEDVLGGLNVPYIVAQPLFVQDFRSWAQNGAGPMQSATLFSLPEMDGAINPVVIGAINNGKFATVPDRLKRLTTLAKGWAELRHTPNADKKVAIVLYDYPPGYGKKGTAALLDVPRSLLNILREMQAAGYNVGSLPETPEALLELIENTTDTGHPSAYKSEHVMTRAQFADVLSVRERERIEERWGAFPGDVAPLGNDRVFMGGLRMGNIYIGVQPRIGVQGDPMRLLFDKDNAPHHQYAAFYRWISRCFGADALVHLGMHGSVEWMPGLQLGVTRSCWSDAMVGEVPHLYIYPMNNPSEANIAKRRGYATIISHNVPPMMRAGLYKELIALKDMVADYREVKRQKAEGRNGDDARAEAILKKVELANLDTDCPRVEGEHFDVYVSRLYAYLRDLEQRLISGTLHVFGEATPVQSQMTMVTEAMKARGNGHSLTSIATRAVWERDGRRETGDGDSSSVPHLPSSYTELAALARKGDAAAIRMREAIEEHAREFVEGAVFGDLSLAAAVEKAFGGHGSSEDLHALDEMVRQGRQMAQMLSDNRGEINGLLRGLSGGYILPNAGGDLIRDGLSVLPTGRNIHAIDPWRIPAELAYTKGAHIAEAILQKHVEETGAYPETIAQVLWGLDTIKTKGEAVGTVLGLIGAKPAYDGQGKISHYALIPLGELKRPRVDVLMQLSPIFRDTFEITMDFLDKLVRSAAGADEPCEMNFIRKHVDEAMRGGVAFETATARMFTQQPGQYGTYVDDMVDDSAWESADDLDSTFVRRIGYAYGGGRAGAAAGPMLSKLLGTVGRVVQEIDSVEFGVTDIDHYFSSSGALQMAAKKRTGGTVKLNYIETYTAETRIEDVDKVLRVEYRTKLLNPKWYEGMLSHGHSGAAEISNRFTYMLGWDAVSDSVDDWIYKDAAQTFALDAEMRERLTKANPQAMRNIVGRLLEASGRGLWKADDDTVDQLKALYADLEDRLEGVRV